MEIITMRAVVDGKVALNWGKLQDDSARAQPLVDATLEKAATRL